MTRSIHKILTNIAPWLALLVFLFNCGNSSHQRIRTQTSAFISNWAISPSVTNTMTSSVSIPWKTPVTKTSVTVKNTAALISPSLEQMTSTPLPLIYYAQSGDTLAAVASHFNISTTEITSAQFLPSQGLIPYNQPLYLPARLARLITPDYILPDSEVVYSSSAVDFNIAAYLRKSGGYLSTYREYLASTGWTSAADIIQRVALENSINPRLLIALLEYHCHCVSGEISPGVDKDALLGNGDYRRAGLFRQLSWASSQLALGYYGWRSGKLAEFSLKDGSIIHPAPNLNAGSVALLVYFAFENNRKTWADAVNPRSGFSALYMDMFGDPWKRASSIEPLLSADLTQTPMQLPFEPGRGWSYTSGPHAAWEENGALAALDFAPATYNSGCLPTDAWVTAVANGLVVRSAFNYVVQDLDDPNDGKSDGLEQTGWAVLYMHIAEKGVVKAGTYLKAGDRIGQPSCEGGRSTGTHVHIARKYNGEWVLADGYLPFNLSGWEAHAGKNPYEGTLTKNGQTVVAHWFGSFETRIALPTVTPITP